jgi:peptidyl-prolyl cis-trans isomerase D
MLKSFRKAVNSWAGAAILGLALAALVVTLFHPNSPGGADETVLATVDGRPITMPRYVRLVEAAVARERERNPHFTVADFLRAGGGQAVLDQMIAAEAIRSFARAHGIAVSERMVDGEIASIPAMQINGRFDEATFRRLLAEQRISESELRDSIAADISRRELLQPVGLGANMPPGMAEPYARLLLEARSGEILAVPAAAMPAPAAPAPGTLDAFYQSNIRRYTVPERRAFRYAILEPAAMASAARPDRKAVEDYYNAHAAEFGGVELREINQILLRSAEDAKAFVAEVRGGAAFAEAAARRQWAESDVRLGQVAKDALARDTSRAVADTAFRLKPGAVSDPVKSPLGFHVLQVTRIVPPTPRPLAAVQGEIIRRLSETRTQDLLSDAVERAEDQLAKGMPLADVASGLGLKLVTMAPTSADGRQFGPDWSARRIDEGALLQQIFTASAEDGPQVAEMSGNRFLLFEITATTAPRPIPAAAIRRQLLADWMAQRRLAAARATAERIAGETASGLTAAAAANRLPAPQELTVRRLELTQMASQGRQVPPPVLLLLTLAPGKARTIAAPDGQGWFVVRLDKVEPGNLAETPQLTEAVRQGMQREARDELMEVFVRTIEREAGVVRQPQALAAANRRLAGQ